MQRMARYAVIVVLYNPGEEVIENIKQYKDSVKTVYCVDNSEKLNCGFNDIDGVKYIPLYKNRGVAYALNVGCREAIKDNCEIITTLDQDTFCEKKTINALFTKLEILNRKRDDCVVAPNIKYIYRGRYGERRLSEEIVYPCKTEKTEWVITSGCTFFASTFKKIGGFDSILFIGQVDCDFCFKVNSINGCIVRLGNEFIYQEFGNTEKKYILNKEVHIPNLSSDRYYYLFRNERYLIKKWGRDYRRYKIPQFKYLASIILFEKNKYLNLLSCIKGTIDGCKMYKRSICR